MHHWLPPYNATELESVGESCNHWILTSNIEHTGKEFWEIKAPSNFLFEIPLIWTCKEYVICKLMLGKDFDKSQHKLTALFKASNLFTVLLPYNIMIQHKHYGWGLLWHWQCQLIVVWLAFTDFMVDTILSELVSVTTPLPQLQTATEQQSWLLVGSNAIVSSHTLLSLSCAKHQVQTCFHQGCITFPILFSTYYLS